MSLKDKLTVLKEICYIRKQDYTFQIKSQLHIKRGKFLMKKIASILTNQLLINEIIPEIMKEVYQYGFELILSNSLTALSILLLASFLDTVEIGIWFLIISIPLKMTVGGYHAPTYLKCYIISTLEYIFQSLVIKIILKLSPPIFFWILLLSCGAIYILINAPIKNIINSVGGAWFGKNFAKVLKKNKFFSILFLSIDCLILIALYILKKNLFVYWGIICIFTIAIFILPTKRKEGRKYGSS